MRRGSMNSGQRGHVQGRQRAVTTATNDVPHAPVDARPSPGFNMPTIDIEIEQSRLLAALAAANGVADKRSNNMPILANALITAVGTKAVIAATDMIRSTTEEVDADLKS